MGIVTSGTSINEIARWPLDYILHDDSHYDFALDQAVDAYLGLCGYVPFDSLRAISAELPLTADQGEYDLDTLLTDGIAGIISIRLALSSTQHRKLKRSSTSVFDRISNPVASQPALYARFGNKIELYPIPSSSAYTIRIRYWAYPTLETDVKDTTLQIPKEWDQLLKWELLYRLYNGPLGMTDKAMMMVAPAMLPKGGSVRYQRDYGEMGILPRLWNQLLQTISDREHIDENFSINPMSMAYTQSPYNW